MVGSSGQIDVLCHRLITTGIGFRVEGSANRDDPFKRKHIQINKNQNDCVKDDPCSDIFIMMFFHLSMKVRNLFNDFLCIAKISFIICGIGNRSENRIPESNSKRRLNF